MVKRAIEMEGTVTGEHGIGLIKRDYLEHELGESTVDAMRRVSFTDTVPLASFTNPILNILFLLFTPIEWTLANINLVDS